MPAAPAGYGAEKILTVGVSGTYTGGFAAVGKNVCDGMTDYLNHLAVHGGIVYKDPATGREEHAALRIVAEDNQYNVGKAVIAYSKLKAQGANAIIGFGSTPGEACAAIALQDRLPYLSWYSYASPAGYRPKPQYYWSFLSTIAESATPMIKWFAKQKWQGPGKAKIGIMAAEVPSWKVLGKPGMMDSYMQNLGAEFAGVEFIPLGAADLSAPLDRLLFQKKADCLILIGTTAQTAVLAKNLRKMEVDTEKITVICSLSAWDESLFKSVPQEVEGLYGEVHAVSPDADIPGMVRLKAVAKAAGRNPENIVMNYINGFTGGFALETAIRRALEKHGYEKVAESGQAIQEELNSFAPADPLGLAPVMETKYTDQPYFVNNARIVRAKNGRFQDAGGWIPIDRISGSLEF